jgi:flagellar motility protein MotE (MotC chaperone)
MKRILIYGLAGTMLFAASATISLWTQQQMLPKADADAAHATKSTKEGGAKAAHEAPKTDSAEELRPVVRPSGPPSPEDTARLANSLRDRLKVVREREEQVGSRQKQLELIYQDIRGERNVLDELRKQVADEMKALNDKLVSMDRKAGDFEQQRQSMAKSMAEIKKGQIDLDGSERKNIDRIATTFDSMAPEAAARILQQMSDNGQLNTAVKLLGQMKERQAAKVLAELTDASLAAQMLEKMRGLKRAGASATTAAVAPASAAPVSTVPTSATEIPR